MNKLATAASVPRQFDHVPCESYALFVADTQGSAKPPPWAESCNRFAVNPTLDDIGNSFLGLSAHAPAVRDGPPYLLRFGCGPQSPTGSWADFCNRFAVSPTGS
jgi:hypothetical protein